MGTQTPQITSNKLPVIDMSGQRGEVSKLIVKACEEMGFFKVINHGVPMSVVSNLEDASCKFFAKPSSQKEMASEVHNPPYGYGCKNIGLKGDVGEVEYLILRADPHGCSHNISFRYDAACSPYACRKHADGERSACLFFG